MATCPSGPIRPCVRRSPPLVAAGAGWERVERRGVGGAYGLV